WSTRSASTAGSASRQCSRTRHLQLRAAGLRPRKSTSAPETINRAPDLLTRTAETRVTCSESVRLFRRWAHPAPGAGVVGDLEDFSGISPENSSRSRWTAGRAVAAVKCYRTCRLASAVAV